MLKKIIYLLLCLVIISCVKNQTSIQADTYLDKTIAILKDSLNTEDLKNIDFNRYDIALNNDSTEIIKFKLNSTKYLYKLVFIKIDKIKNKRFVNIISLTREITENENTFNGDLKIKNLKYDILMNSNIVNGKASTNKIENISSNSTKEKIIFDDDDLYYAPEVLVTGYKHVSLWLSMMLLFDKQISSCYINLEMESSDLNESIITLDIEDPIKKKPRTLKSFIDCFGTISDNGAKYKISISTDVPIDRYPWMYALNLELSPGHVFITLTKSNPITGGEISQNIGFYPSVPSLSTIPSILVDDEMHPYNAQYSIEVNSLEFQNALNNASTFSTHEYNFYNFNCATFALGVFNSFRNNLNANPDFGINTNTPQSVYAAIKNLSNYNNEAICFSLPENAKASYGPCN